MDYKFIALDEEIRKNDLINQEEYRIRIYGNIIGNTKDIISFWHAIEKNYINIIVYRKILRESSRDEIEFRRKNYTPSRKTEIYFYGKRVFMDYYEKYDEVDIISPDEYPIITKVNFNSPGFWEVIGEWNIFEQLRKYIQERHLRDRDKKYAWDLENRKKLVEIESQQLSNDLLKLDITQTMIHQIKDLGLSDIEIRHVVQKSYRNLELLNSHIDDERIVEIKKVDLNGNEI